jgi:hypothetical protein
MWRRMVRQFTEASEDYMASILEAATREHQIHENHIIECRRLQKTKSCFSNFCFNFMRMCKLYAYKNLTL